MHCCKNGRIDISGISFQRPDGFEFISFRVEQSLFLLHAPDHSVVVRFMIACECMDTYTELKYLFSDFPNLQLRGEIKHIFQNGITGHQAIYSEGDGEYLVTRFALAGDRHLVVLIYGNQPIENILQRPDMIAFMQSFRKKETKPNT